MVVRHHVGVGIEPESPASAVSDLPHHWRVIHLSSSQSLFLNDDIYKGCLDQIAIPCPLGLWNSQCTVFHLPGG